VGAGATTLRIELGGHRAVEADEPDDAVRLLREEMLALDVLDVRATPVPAPAGTRAVEAVATGTLLVTLNAGLLAIIARAVHAWIARGGARSAVLQIGDDRIEITGASREDQQRLIDAFVARHVPEED
jgi:hypothetical protein